MAGYRLIKMNSVDFRPITGLAIAGYRSFGPEIQKIGPLRKINLIIGQNNAGKSNILRLIHEEYNNFPSIISGGSIDWSGLEVNNITDSPRRAVGMGLDIKDLSDSIFQHLTSGSSRASEMERVISFLREDDPCGDGIWFESMVETYADGSVLGSGSMFKLMNKFGWEGFFHNLSMTVRGVGHGDHKSNVREVLSWIVTNKFQPVQCATIPTYRRVNPIATAGSGMDGSNLIERLAELQQPSHDEWQKLDDFEKIERFLQSVIDRPDARLKIPNKKDTINVGIGGRFLPLDALGTGVQQVIIMAAAATSLHKHVVCIEEPEVHLHPLLQKKLLRYLDEQTENQYFISTHSVHLLDHPGAAVFHIRMTETGSKVTSASQPSQHFEICSDLGYRASDLLQTNCILWVEGPSDRVYLREWIRLAAPDLIEGVDYSVMFYGGRLLSHLSPDDKDVSEFISLRKLNRNMVILMDSDKLSSASEINKTKKRIEAEWNSHSGFAWVTAGREIENYVDPDAMLQAMQAVAPSGVHKRPKTEFAQCIGKGASGKPLADKINVAHWLEHHRSLGLTRLDLEARLKQLISFIRESNVVKAIPRQQT